MASFELVLCTPDAPNHEISLWFELCDSSIARKYYEALDECERERYSIYDPARFYNLPGSMRDRSWIAVEINRCIDVINTYAPNLIVAHATPEMDQSLLNVLHHHFEVNRGSILNPARFFTDSPAHVRRALEDLNLAIHRYEFLERHINTHPLPQFVVTFDPRRPRYTLSDEDYTCFVPRAVFGGWYVNYCEVGKPLWDAFQDDDDVIGDENIFSLRHYSCDALVRLSDDDPAIHEQLGKDFVAWWRRNEEKLGRLGYRWGEPRNAIGLLPVAHLDRTRGSVAGLHATEIVELVGRYQYLSRIACHRRV